MVEAGPSAASGDVRQWTIAGRRLWQSGQYPLAVRAFEHAAAGGGEAETVALVRARLALGQVEAAARLVADATARWPGAATLAGYQALLTYAGGNSEAAARLVSGLPAGNTFCAAVRATLGRHLGLEPVQPAAPDNPWSPVLEGYQWLAPQPDVHWVAFPTQLIELALQRAPREGLCVECGVYYGRSIALLAAGRAQVFGFDSFQGLPEAWSDREPAGTYSTAGRLPEVPDNVELIAGWFEDTLPAFAREHAGQLDLLHVDCDLYSSTVTVLEHLADRLQPGSLVLFDDYLGYPGWQDHEHRAWLEAVQQRSIRFRYLAGCLLGREVLVEILS